MYKKVFLFLSLLVLLTSCQKTVYLQFTPPNEDEEIAILHTTVGEIKIRLFPEEAPLAVENFITHAKNGYYDGVIFHRVINEFMIQSGDPEGTGMGGESIWGNGFKSEQSKNLKHFRGALSMAHSSIPDSNGSQFFIVQKSTFDQEEIFNVSPEGEPIKYKDVLSKDAVNAYNDNGGTPFLDLDLNQDGHTVFGQVIEGMDIVDAIAAAPTDDSDKPITDIIINSISFELYKQS